MAIANRNSGVKSTSHVTGRCAPFNAKLHFFSKISSKEKFMHVFHCMVYNFFLFSFIGGITLPHSYSLDQCVKSSDLLTPAYKENLEKQLSLEQQLAV